MVVDDILGVVNEVTPEPDVNTAPPLETPYQSIVSPAPGVADIITVPVAHTDPPVPLGADGEEISCVTVMLDVAVQPLAPVAVTVYVPAAVMLAFAEEPKLLLQE